MVVSLVPSSKKSRFPGIFRGPFHGPFRGFSRGSGSVHPSVHLSVDSSVDYERNIRGPMDRLFGEQNIDRTWASVRMQVYPRVLRSDTAYPSRLHVQTQFSRIHIKIRATYIQAGANKNTTQKNIRTVIFDCPRRYPTSELLLLDVTGQFVEASYRN